eukprot:EG_transcript_3750
MPHRDGVAPTSLHAVAKRNNSEETRAEMAKATASELLEPEAAGQTPLHFAAVFNNVAFLQLAYQRFKEAAPFELPDSCGRCPIHLAVWNGHISSAEFLISIGVDLNRQEKGGYTPLYFAVYREQLDMVKLLIHNMADISLRSMNSESASTPLNQACMNGNVAVIKVLLGLDATALPLAGVGESALAAAWRTSSPTARRPSGARSAPPPDEGSSHSHSHSDSSHGHGHSRSGRRQAERRTERSAPQGVDAYHINVPDVNGNTPLINAIRNRHFDVARLLIEVGADVNKGDKHKETPLHLAVNAGEEKYVQLLLEEGFDKRLDPTTRLNLCAKNRNGATPLDIALANDAEPIIRMLEARGLRRPEDERPVPEALLCCLCGRLLFQPAALACGHAACLYCVTAAMARDPDHPNQFSCPKRCVIKHAGPPMISPDLERRIKEDLGDEAYQRREEAFFKHRGNALLADLSRHQNRNPALRFNENNTCEIAHEGLLLRITLLKKELYVYHTLMKGLPPDPKKRLKLLEYILEGNLLGSTVCSGGITILTNSDVVMHMSAQLHLAKSSALREIVTVFAKCARGWHQHLVPSMEGDVRALEKIISESPAPILVSERVGDFEKAQATVECFQAALPEAERAGLYFDNNKTWHLKNARFSLSITYEPRSDCIYVYSPVWNMMPKKEEVRLHLFEKLLRLNLFFSDLPGNGIGIDLHGDFVLMHIILQLGSVPHTHLRDLYRQYVAQVERCVQVVGQCVHQGSGLHSVKLTKQQVEALRLDLDSIKLDCASPAVCRILDQLLEWVD